MASVVTFSRTPSAMRAAWTMKMGDRRQEWYAEVGALSKDEQKQFAAARDAMLANAKLLLKDEARIAKCIETKGRPPMRRSNQRVFTSGAGLSFHIYVQVGIWAENETFLLLVHYRNLRV